MKLSYARKKHPFSIAAILFSAIAIVLLTLSNHSHAAPVTSPTSTPVPEMSITGISKRVSLQDPTEIQALWQEFENLTKLHLLVNWREPVTLYAYFNDFSRMGTSATLYIGYSVKALKKNSPSPPSLQLIGGNYQSFSLPVDSQDEYLHVWDEALANRLPKTILEKYQLNAKGQPQSATLNVLFE